MSNQYLQNLDKAWKQHLAPRETNAPTVVSTFAGCGGSSLGYSMAGFKELLAVEWDDHAVKTFEANFPEVPVFHGDICHFSVENALMAANIKPGELDVFDGSPPCQGFSMAGRRIIDERAIDDERNQLFRQYVRLIDGFKPKVIVMENVPGMIRGEFRRIQGEILDELRAIGYNVSCRLLSAQLLGVPQKRQRLIFIGVRKDLGIMPSHPAPNSAPINCSQAFQNLAPDNSKTLTGQGLYLWQRTNPGEGFDKVHPKGHWFNATKISPRKPAPTMTKLCSPAAIGLFHWEAPRILNIAEAKRISSFPDGYKFEGKFNDQWARMGNCVPPLMIKAVADHIRKEILEKI